MKKTTLFFALLVFITPILFAVPAYPEPVTTTQPDGSEITVRIKGDERINWYETLDGYTLLFDKNGFFVYAYLDGDGNLQPSHVIATNIEERDFVANTFLSTIDKNLYYSDMQRHFMLQIWQMEDETYREFANKEMRGVHLKTLCALVDFPDKSMTFAISDFEPLMNQLGYTGTGISGSVRDYFREASYGDFDLEVTLCGPYTAPNNQVYYAGSQAGQGSLRCGELATWIARQVAAEPHINFNDFSSTNNFITGFHFIFAGRCQASGGGAGTIWSHAGNLQSYVSKNGKTISRYSCSPELRSPTAITTIGVICHEMGHAVLGLSDFYDTNYETGGKYDGTGRWDLMAEGCYNGSPSGSCPSHFNPHSKILKGWITPIVLSSSTEVVDMPNAAENRVVYRINTTTPNEYFLLENRQRIKFDAGIRGDGLLIYRVHSQINSAIQNNAVNVTSPQRFYPVAANAPVAIPASGSNAKNDYGTIDAASCPWPGTLGKTEFSDTSIPSMKSWAGANTNNSITNITHSNRLISFNFTKQLSIENNALQNITIYCHNNILSISNTETYTSPLQVEVFDMIGKLVYNAMISNAENFITLSVSDGIYNVKVSSPDGKFVTKKVSIAK